MVLLLGSLAYLYVHVYVHVRSRVQYPNIAMRRIPEGALRTSQESLGLDVSCAEVTSGRVASDAHAAEFVAHSFRECSKTCGKANINTK